MFSVFMALFIVMPIFELMVLFKVYSSFGGWNTFVLVVMTGVLGVTMARRQGLMVLREIQSDLSCGRMPAPRLLDGLMIIIAGVLLMTPGLITDITGFLLLMPFVRSSLRSWLRMKFESMIRQNQVTFWKW